MPEATRTVILRDSTLREGMDVPGVAFSFDQRLQIAAALAEAGVPEAEVVAPSRVAEDIQVARAMRARGLPIRSTALVYANRPGWRQDLELACDNVDHIDLLMPLSAQREPR